MQAHGYSTLLSVVCSLKPAAAPCSGHSVPHSSLIRRAPPDQQTDSVTTSTFALFAFRMHPGEVDGSAAL